MSTGELRERVAAALFTRMISYDPGCFWCEDEPMSTQEVEKLSYVWADEFLALLAPQKPSAEERESKAVSLLRALLHTAEDEWGVDTYQFEASHAAQEFLDGLSGAPQKPSAEERRCATCGTPLPEDDVLCPRPGCTGGESLARAPRDAEPVALGPFIHKVLEYHESMEPVVGRRFHDTDGEAAYIAARIAEHFGPLYATPPESEAPAWRPIETAPKDRTPVLVWMPEKYAGSHIHVAVYREKFGTIAGRFDFDAPTSPTHWMPLPASPTEPETEGGRDG